MLDKSIVVGMLAALLLWVGMVAYASSLLVWRNWRLFMTWCEQDRETRIRLSLWLAIPMMKVSILSFAGHALWSLVAGYRVSDLAIVRALVVIPFVLTSAVLMLRWTYDRRFGVDGDRMWRRLMWIGCGLAASVFGASYYL